MGLRRAAGGEAVAAGTDSTQPVELPVSHSPPVLPGHTSRGHPALASHFDGHDLIVAFGAPIFTYHEFADGDYLPAGAELWAVTSDPDEAARAPVGHIPIGDSAEAVKRLADTMQAAGRQALAARELPQADTTGPAFTEEAIMDAVTRR
jgi:benzoylformate decarboxylase